MEDSSPSSVQQTSSSSILTSIISWFTPTILFIFLNLMIATILFTSNLPKPRKEDQNDTLHSQNDSKLARSPSILHRLRSINFYPHKSHPDSSPATNQPPQQTPLELAATQFVFNHPFPHDSLNDFELDPTPKPESDAQLADSPNNFDFDPTQKPESEARLADSNHTNEVKLANTQTHFVIEQHTVEKVTTHYDYDYDYDFDFDPTRVDTGIEEENDELQSLDEVYSSITGGHVNRTKSDTVPASGEVQVKLPAKMKKSASMKSAFSHFEEEKIVEARRPATVRERRSAARVTADDDVEVDAKADDFINKFKNQLKLQRLDSIIRYKDMVNRGSGK